MTVYEINSNDFKEKISKGKVLVDYFGSWCQPCKILYPIIEELSNEIKDIKFYKLDVDESGDVAQSYEVMGIPTLILFNNGKEVKRIVGVKSKEELKKELK
jgi:thioredoxin 1